MRTLGPWRLHIFSLKLLHLCSNSSVRPSVCLSVCLYVCMSVFLQLCHSLLFAHPRLCQPNLKITWANPTSERLYMPPARHCHTALWTKHCCHNRKAHLCGCGVCCVPHVVLHTHSGTPHPCLSFGVCAFLCPVLSPHLLRKRKWLPPQIPQRIRALYLFIFLFFYFFLFATPVLLDRWHFIG